MIFNRKHTYISIFFVGTMAFGQVNRPNATPYTNEGTFEKFKKKFGDNYAAATAKKK